MFAEAISKKLIASPWLSTSGISARGKLATLASRMTGWLDDFNAVNNYHLGMIFTYNIFPICGDFAGGFERFIMTKHDKTNQKTLCHVSKLQRTPAVLPLHATFHWGNSKLSELLHVCHVWVVRTPAMRRWDGRMLGVLNVKLETQLLATAKLGPEPPSCLPSVPVGATLGESVVGFQDFGCDILLQDGQEAFPVEDGPGISRDTELWTAKATERHDKATSAASKSGSWFNSTGCFMNSLSLDNKENNTHIQSNKNPVYIYITYICIYIYQINRYHIGHVTFRNISV